MSLFPGTWPGLSCRGDSQQCASCCQAGQQAASSMRGLRAWGAGFMMRKFKLSLWKQLKTDHLLIIPPCPFNIHKTGCLFYFHGATVCEWKCAFLLSIYPHQQGIEPNKFLLEEKKKWKKGICWLNNWNRFCYLFQKGLTVFSFIFLSPFLFEWYTLIHLKKNNNSKQAPSCHIPVKTRLK